MIGRQWKICVLCSGGLDSVIALRRAQQAVGAENVLGLWVDLGHPYALKERRALEGLGLVRSFQYQHSWSPRYPVVRRFFNLIAPIFENEPTPDDQIIPGRNMLLATMAAAYAPEIWLAALHGEMHARMVDKNETFFRIASDSLSYTFGRDTLVRTPFADKTKAQMLREALTDKTITPVEVNRTSTCYHPTLLRCGECSACLKRAIACELAGVIEEYRVDPFTTPAAAEYLAAHLRAWDTGDHVHYNRVRCEETMLAFETAGRRRREAVK